MGDGKRVDYFNCSLLTGHDDRLCYHNKEMKKTKYIALYNKKYKCKIRYVTHETKNRTGMCNRAVSLHLLMFLSFRP